VKYNKCSHDKEIGLIVEPIEEEKLCWRVYFPQGHSIRITEKKELERLGYHIKPRIIDMVTGDVLDTGGDLYDFNNPQDDDSIVLLPDDDDDDPIPVKKK
jgi:hypothetical protein